MCFQRSTRSSPPRLPLLSQRLGAAQTTGAAEGADAAGFKRLRSGGKDVTLILNFPPFSALRTAAWSSTQNLLLEHSQVKHFLSPSRPALNASSGVSGFKHIRPPFLEDLESKQKSHELKVQVVSSSSLMKECVCVVLCETDACCVMEQKDEGGLQTDSPCGAKTQPGQAGLCE